MNPLRLCIVWLLIPLGAHGVVAADHLTYDSQGGIIRGARSAKRLALVFTGDTHGESTEPILNTLAARRIRGSLFVTGNFVRQPGLQQLLRRAIAEGHYVGPHSDRHLLYASWEDRGKSLITEAAFAADLRQNMRDLQALGALGGGGPIYFIPPYEHYNRDQVEWSRKMGISLLSFSPGSGSNRDYAPEGDARFVSSRQIHDDILAHEQRDPHGLNGFILLLHLGSGRKDPFHPRLGPLCDTLANRGYRFVRIDELLGPASHNALK